MKNNFAEKKSSVFFVVVVNVWVSFTICCVCFAEASPVRRGGTASSLLGKQRQAVKSAPQINLLLLFSVASPSEPPAAPEGECAAAAAAERVSSYGS